eukprot:SAG31_NODE_838_length_11617_cov_36.512936_14_plen_150_part_00
MFVVSTILTGAADAVTSISSAATGDISAEHSKQSNQGWLPKLKAVNSIGRLVGGAAGAILASIDLQAPWNFAAGLITVFFLLGLVLLKETQPQVLVTEKNSLWATCRCSARVLKAKANKLVTTLPVYLWCIFGFKFLNTFVFAVSLQQI